MMAKKQVDPYEIPTRRQWETRAKRPLGDGVWPGIDGSLWLWRMVPQGAVANARTKVDAERVGVPLAQAYEALAGMTSRGSRRSQVRGSYRDTQTYLVNVPALYAPNPQSKLRSFLTQEHGNTQTLQRALLFGVRLIPKVGNGKWRDAIDSFIETAQSQGAPLSDYQSDIKAVSDALASAGFRVPDRKTLHLADSWWNLGGTAGVPVMPHDEHMHFFRNARSARKAEAIEESHPGDCSQWDGEGISEHAITFAAVADFDMHYLSTDTLQSKWVLPLLESGARVISIRATVEPSRVTRNELKSQRRRYRADLRSLAESNKDSRAEIEEQEQELDQIERAYATGAPATLHEASVIVGFDGIIEDVVDYSPPGLILSPMTNRQGQAWHETMVCSAVRANPLIHDIPSSNIAYSGLPNVSRVGDDDGALLGFTESDRQESLVSPIAASRAETYPYMGVYGATGSGKSMVMWWLAEQWHLMGHPQVLINPKAGQSFEDECRAVGGTYVSFGSFEHSDGALDPLRIIENRREAIQKAASMIAMVNPFGSDVSKHMTSIANAIQYGVNQGAEATGQAINIAARDGVLARELAETINQFADVYPLFRATYGLNPATAAFSLGNGLTLIEVGESGFELPPPNFQGEPADLRDPVQRCSMNIIRMLLWGSVAALRHRAGIIHFDESWVMEKGVPADMDQIGRLTRSWGILPVLYTQKPKAQVDMGLKGYISRALIGHIKDGHEAKAALSIFDAQDNEYMLDRITANRYLTDNAGLNWNSLQTLPNPNGTGVVRGSVWFYFDLHNRIAPVEVTLTKRFLDLVASGSEDIQRREKAKAALGEVAN